VTLRRWSACEVEATPDGGEQILRELVGGIVAGWEGPLS
jgi:hypothetical protein